MTTAMITDKTFIQNAMTSASCAKGLFAPVSNLRRQQLFPLDPDGLIIIDGSEGVPFLQSLRSALEMLEDLQPLRVDAFIRGGGLTLAEAEEIEGLFSELCHPRHLDLLFDTAGGDVPSARIFISRNAEKAMRGKGAGGGILSIVWSKLRCGAIEAYDTEHSPE